MIQTRPHRFLGLQMAQNGYALLALNKLLETLQPARIIEIGTRCGGLTAFLGIYCRQMDVEFFSCDISDEFLVDSELLKFLGVDFRVEDCFAVEMGLGEMIASDGPTLVLCDGGDKPREVRTFSKYLKPGDVICGHDYKPCDHWRPKAEIVDEDVEGLGLEPFLAEVMRKAAWLCRRKP